MVPIFECPCVCFRPIWQTGCLTSVSVSTTRFWCRTGMKTLTLSPTSVLKICKRSELLNLVRNHYVIKMGNIILKCMWKYRAFDWLSKYK